MGRRAISIIREDIPRSLWQYVPGEFVVAGCASPEVPEAAEHAFDDVAVAMGGAVEGE